jgi:hypothetical protein
MWKWTILIAVLAIAAAPVLAQEPVPAAERLRIFLDCRSDCDFDYIRQEMSFVDYVRDRADADVHILVTSQQTGPGGREYTLNLIGLRTFAAISDTVRYVSPQEDTEEIRRRGLVRVLKVGLMRFIAATPLAPRMNIELSEEEERAGAGPAQVRDPWNFWVFRIGVDGSIDGESQQESRDVSLELSANRTTANWKIDIGLDGSYEDETFEIEADEEEGEPAQTIFSLRRSYELDLLIVKSLGARLSTGIEASVESSTFGNEEFSWRFAPAVEYNVFPYAESTRRSFVFRYGVGFNSFNWKEITIFGETEETRPRHALSIGYATSEEWGESSLSLDLSQYLHDTTKNRISVSGNVEVRVLRGLSLDLNGGYARVHDQLSIPARGATPQEIFLRLRQLRTSYEFDASIGITYRFGSIFNNVVNPRFRRGFNGFN